MVKEQDWIKSGSAQLSSGFWLFVLSMVIGGLLAERPQEEVIRWRMCRMCRVHLLTLGKCFYFFLPGYLIKTADISSVWVFKTCCRHLSFLESLCASTLLVCSYEWEKLFANWSPRSEDTFKCQRSKSVFSWLNRKQCSCIKEALKRCAF